MYRILRDMYVAIATPPYPSGRSNLTRLKCGMLKLQVGRNYVSESKAIEHFDEVKMCCNEGRRAGGLRKFHCNTFI